MSIQDLLKELRIENKEPYENENGSYTIDLDNSNEYSRYYSKLDKSDMFEEDEEASQVSIETSSIQYLSDDFIVTLMANFDTDEYKLIIREIDNRLN